MENTTIQEENVEKATKEVCKSKLPALIYYNVFKDNDYPIDRKVFLDILRDLAYHEEFRVKMAYLDGKGYNNKYDSHDDYFLKNYQTITHVDETI